MTILVIEDDPDAREVLTWLLESAGYRAFAARGGAEALELLREVGADLIVLDLRMPDMDGWQFLEQKRADPALAPIPVVILTGDRRAAADAETLPAAACLRKPLDVDRLLPVIARYQAPATRRAAKR